MNKKLWFKAKRYGWGWTPCSFEGWLTIVVFVIFEYLNFLKLSAETHVTDEALHTFLIRTLLAVIVLICISYWKGERPSWRWGDK